MTIPKFILLFLMIASSLFAAPSDNEILSVLKEYLILNNPNILDDMLPGERRERIEEFNADYRELSENLGKEEVFYFMRLSRAENPSPFVRDSAILRVPIEYLEHYEEYEDGEKRRIGEFIWEHKQKGVLRLRHLRRVENPTVIQFLKEQYDVEGGPGTGRGYEIKKMLDEINLPDPSGESAAGRGGRESVVVLDREAGQSDFVAGREESREVVQQKSRRRSLWIAGGLFLLVGLGLVLGCGKVFRSSRG